MLHLIDHPLVRCRLTALRDRDCGPARFRRLVRELAAFMVHEVTADLDVEEDECQTPLEAAPGARLARPVVLAPVLRAGLGMLDGFLDLLPEAAVAHVGLARDEETLQPASYYFRVPPCLADADVIIVDPMLATGGSAVEAVRQLKAAGADRLRIACLVAAPEGVKALEQAHPEVPIFAAAVDRELDSHGYIRPGLGDAGDRIFGTL